MTGEWCEKLKARKDCDGAEWASGPAVQHGTSGMP